MNFCIVSNPERHHWQAPVQEIINKLVSKNKQVFISEAIAAKIGPAASKAIVCKDEATCLKKSDLVIAIGGDGTILHTARLIHDSGKPILGINCGKLGFLADTQLHQLHEALDQLLSNNWETEPRFMLQAESNGKTFFALNEFLFTKNANVSMITLEVFCDGLTVNKYWADGLIFATPTGSTAYNLSAGGPVILPETDVMVITPVCPHALTTRSLVLPARKKIQVTAVPVQQEILFSGDGKICDLDTTILNVEISKADVEINLIKLPGRNYYETLRTKLMWGLDLRE